MTADKLNQLRYLNKEIKLIEEQIEGIEPKMTSDKVVGSSLEFPYTLQSFKITGLNLDEYNRKLKRLQRKLQLRLDELTDLVEKMNEYLYSVEDSEMRQILTLRYVHGQTWDQIAFQLGYADESVPRKKCDRFLK